MRASFISYTASKCSSFLKSSGFRLAVFIIYQLEKIILIPMILLLCVIIITAVMRCDLHYFHRITMIFQMNWTGFWIGLFACYHRRCKLTAPHSCSMFCRIDWWLLASSWYGLQLCHPVDFSGLHIEQCWKNASCSTLK